MIIIFQSQYTNGYDCCLGARLSDPSSASSKQKDLGIKNLSSGNGQADSVGLTLIAEGQYYCKMAKDGTDASESLWY